MNKVNRLTVTLVFMVLVIFMSCAIPKSYEVATDFNKEKLKRVGLLVIRVGNAYPEVPAPITLLTDYSIRVPKKQSKTALKVDKIDVYIEDEDRLRESLPNYPHFDKMTLPIQKAKYFKNISPELFKAVRSVFLQKGYDVYDIQEISNDWTTKLSDMTISEIVNAVKDSVDSLCVVHYTDVADYYQDSTNLVIDSKGFSHLDYTLSMFDTSSNRRILFFEPSTVRIANALTNDPDIKSDPELSQKVTIQESRKKYEIISGRETIELYYTFTDEEVVQYVMKYVRLGLTYESGSMTLKWHGLTEIIP